jgi:hypothetical protein
LWSANDREAVDRVGEPTPLVVNGTRHVSLAGSPQPEPASNASVTIGAWFAAGPVNETVKAGIE